MTDVELPAGRSGPDEAGTNPAGAEGRGSLGTRLRFLATPRWIALIIGAIAFALACYLILAPWQFGRNVQRSEQNAAIASAIKAAPVPITRLMSLTEQPPTSAIWHQVTVTGTFDASREVYIRLRQDGNGNPASEVVVPFVTADGTAVLVDRGYVSFTSVQQRAALPALPSGTVTVTGRVQADQTDPKNRPAVPAPDGRMQYTAASSTLAGPGPVFRGYLQLTDTSPGVISAVGLPQEDGGPFFSYALQWLAFGAIAVLGIGYFIYREFADPVDEDIYLPEEGEPADQQAGGDGTRHVDGQATGGDGLPADTARQSGARGRQSGARGRQPGGGPGGASGSGDEPAGPPPDPQRPGDGDSRAVGADRRRGRGRRGRKPGFDKSQLYDPQ